MTYKPHNPEELSSYFFNNFLSHVESKIYHKYLRLGIEGLETPSSKTTSLRLVLCSIISIPGVYIESVANYFLDIPAVESFTSGRSKQLLQHPTPDVIDYIIFYF